MHCEKDEFCELISAIITMSVMKMRKDIDHALKGGEADGRFNSTNDRLKIKIRGSVILVNRKERKMIQKRHSVTFKFPKKTK